MTASRKPKTPSMSMVVRKGVSLKDIDTFCKRAGRLTLSQVVDKVTVKETLASNGGSRTKDFSIELNFYPKQDYQAEYDIKPSEILSAFGTKFPLILKREIQNELKKFEQDMKAQMAEIGKGKTVRERVAGEADAEAGDEDFEEGRTGHGGRDEDEASEVGDGDATATKRQRQSKEQATYDDDEDDDDAMEQYDDDAIEAAYASARESEDEDMSADDDVDAEDLSAQIEVVEQNFLQNFSYTKSFSFHESGCTIELQVSSYRERLRLMLICLFSSVPTCPSSCWSALWKRRAQKLLFARYPASPTVSRARKTRVAKKSTRYVAWHAS